MLLVVGGHGDPFDLNRLRGKSSKKSNQGGMIFLKGCFFDSLEYGDDDSRETPRKKKRIQFSTDKGNIPLEANKFCVANGS